MAFFRWILLLIVLQGDLIAAFERSHRPASSFSLGISGVVSDDPGQWLVNPASVSATRGIYLLGSFSPAPFGLTELSEAGIGGAAATGIGGIGLSASVFGTRLYRESTARFAWGTKPGESVEVGIACSYYALTVQGYGNAGTVGFDIGAIAALGRSIRLGAVAANINAPVIGTCREKLPQMLSLAAAIDILPRFSFSAELVRDARFPLSLRCGVEYRPLNSFSLSFGAAGDPAIVGGGFSVAFSKIRLEYAAQYHQQLGVSHFVSLLFTFSDFLRGDQHIGLLN